MRHRTIVTATLLALTPVLAKADTLSSGTKAFNKGDYATARDKWMKSSSPQASYNLGILAEMGNLPGCDRVNCAANWYASAAREGYVPAMTLLGILYVNNGHKPEGLSWLTQAARWDNGMARDILRQMEEPVPAADLYLAALKQQSQAEEMRRQQANQALAFALAAGAVAWGSTHQGVPNSYAPTAAQSINRQPPPPTPSRTVIEPQSRTSLRICPDGSYASGTCTLAPNGRYVSGRPTLAPDGTYVGGTPQLTPRGDYVGGDSPLSYCPDGSYVPGRCTLAPNGKYVGQ